MLQFQGDGAGEVKTPRRVLQVNEGFHLASETKSEIAPPSHMPNLYPSRSFITRRYEGGTPEEALPVMQLSLLEGCVVRWNGRQWTEADVQYGLGLCDLYERTAKNLAVIESALTRNISKGPELALAP